MRSCLQVLVGASLLWLGCERAATPPAPSSAAPKKTASAAAPSVAAAPAQPAAAGKAPTRYGAPLSAATAIAAQALLAEPAKYDEKDIKVTGQVNAACQKRGCWMTIGSGEPGQPTVRVTFKDYGFFVPPDCAGKTATVEGHFKIATMSVAEAQHYADDAAKAGAAPQNITAPQRSLMLVATGAELL